MMNSDDEGSPAPSPIQTRVNGTTNGHDETQRGLDRQPQRRSVVQLQRLIVPRAERGTYPLGG